MVEEPPPLDIPIHAQLQAKAAETVHFGNGPSLFPPVGHVLRDPLATFYPAFHEPVAAVHEPNPFVLALPLQSGFAIARARADGRCRIWRHDDVCTGPTVVEDHPRPHRRWIRERMLGRTGYLGIRLVGRRDIRSVGVVEREETIGQDDE